VPRLKAAPVEDPVDGAVLERGSSEASDGIVEGAHSCMQLGANEGCVLQRLDALGDQLKQTQLHCLINATGITARHDRAGDGSDGRTSIDVGPTDGHGVVLICGPPGPNPLVITSVASWTTDSELRRSTSAGNAAVSALSSSLWPNNGDIRFS
jgi:hypothetical protein